MDYELADSSGTDDDLPPSHQNRFQRGGRPAGNGRSVVVGAAPLPRMHTDMETQIHHIEQEAYTSVLRAFKAQSDAITWDKESLITELRKELRVSDEEHRELLSSVNADDIIRRIREWRKASGLQPGMLSIPQPIHDTVPSPTVSASRKKQKPPQSVASLSMGAPSPTVRPSMQPSSSTLRRGLPPGARSKKPKSLMQFPSGLPGRAQVANQGSSGAFMGNEAAEATTYDPLIGRKVWTRWPEDNNFYEAVITDYNPIEGRHALVYDINTTDETWEWVNLKEMLPEDIRWEGEDPGISRRGGRPGPGRGNKKSVARGGAVATAGRGRGMTKGQSKKEFPLAQNGIRKKALGDIEILHTDSLIKEVEKVFGCSQPDPVEIEKAKKVLKEHEQALVDAISRLEDASDGESDEGDNPFSHGQSRGQERAWRKRSYDEMGEAGVVEGSDGNKITRDVRIAPDDPHDDGDDL
ncbi:ENT domain-containing protein [Cephalotus follicularis]|uniref:ENT domain-containing protein n=1 Tax=Cephalotus follicularis TaxID=3775 RepID=A0A1Q3C707_CEPFO|nr:ENT domain-containing protein [Cephalotus follicularis]